MSKEEAESKVKMQLQEEEKFQQKNIVVVITGLMEAGKTTLLHWLFGKPPPREYESTGIAERPWQAHFLDTKEFRLLELKDRLELVAIVKKVKPSKSTEEVEENHNIKTSTKLNPNTSSEVSQQLESSEESSTGKEDTTALSIKEVAEIMRNNPGKWCAKLELVHMIDTGGQPESLEVLPCVIHNANIILLVVDLSKSLDEHVSPTLHKGGVHPFEKPTLPTTNREMIGQLAQTMAGRRRSKVIVIATHTDLIPPQDLPKELDQLNKFVDEVLPHDATFPNTNSKTVFDIAFSPRKPPASMKLESIREYIKGEIIKVKPVPVPVSYALFESEAMHFLSEKRVSGERSVDVMGLKECLEIGEKLSMSAIVLKKALEHFHDNNIFLYFENVGSGLVFIDPKSLMSFVHKMVEFSYKIKGNETLFLTKVARSALKEGTITKEIWQHEYVKNNFVCNIFEEYHAKKIFETLDIIASRSLPPDQSNSSTETEKDEKHIMMCLLPRLSQEEVQRQLQKFKQIKPLFLHFRKGSPDPPYQDQELYSSPCGSFGSVIACLISKFEWKICIDIDKQQPECLYHDIAMLRPSRKSLEVTLVNKTKYLEIYVDLKGEKECEALRVRNHVCCATEIVLNKIKLELSVAEGFECNCGKWKKQHTQFLMEDSEESKEYTLCVGGFKGEPQVFWRGSDNQGMQQICLLQ